MTPRVERIGNATLWLGDCRDVLPTLSGVDAVVTDPPYFGREDLFPTDATTEILSRMWLQIMTFWPWYGADPFCGDAIHIWHKAVPIHPHSQTGNVAGHHYERIFTKGTGTRSEVFRCAAIMPNFAACAEEFAKHPTQKPLELLLMIVPRTSGTCLDPFMGSGTTGVACAKLGRRFIGVEIHEPYFNIACKRIEQAYRQRDLFVAAPVPIDPEEQRVADLFAEPTT